MKNLCKKLLAMLMIVTIFTTYVPAISTIVWAIEDVNNEIENQVTEESTNEKKLDTVVEESNTVNKDNESEQLNDNHTEKSKTIREIIEEKSQEPAKEIMQNQEQEVQKTENQEENNTKGNTRNLDEDTIINLDEKIIRALNNSYCNYDLNNDGEYSIKELADENLTYLNIDCENTTIDLTGVHYMVNLIEIYMYSYNGSIDVSELADLPNLETLTINGDIINISNLELVTNLKWLELSNYNYNSKLNINNVLPSLVNLEHLRMNGRYVIETQQLINLTKLKELILDSWYSEELLDFAALGSLTSLENLTIRYYKLEDMSGLETLTNLTSLSVTLQSERSLDTETIIKMENLQNLYIENFDASNIEWLSEMNQLQSLGLSNYDPEGYEIDSNFFNIINSLEIENITLHISTIYDLGELEADVETEVDFSDIPLVNALIDPNSKIYVEGFELQTDDYNGTENEIEIDNENKKVYITPGENNRRYEYISGDNGTRIKLQWSFESDNEVPEISDMLKQELIDNGFDTNNDGVLTMAELNSEQHSYLNIFFNGNEEIDLTGIENLQKLYGLSLASYNKELDISCIESLTNLKVLNLSGSFTTTSLKELTGLEELTLNIYSDDNYGVLNDIKDLTNLNRLSLNGLRNEPLSPINNLTNLSELKISYRNPEIINVNEISDLINLYELQIENVDASNLSGLENLEGLKILYIDQAHDFMDSIDTITLQKLDNLEELSIAAINDLSWVNNLTMLNEITICGDYGSNGAIELTQGYLDMLNNISARVRLSGQFCYNLGNFEVGSQFEQNLNEFPLLQEMNEPNSKLYANSIDIYETFYGEHEDWSYDSENRVLSFTVNEVREYSTSFSINYNSNSRNDYISLSINWKGYVNGSKNPVTIIDDNLRQELLENYDIDGDEVITEHDMINASYIDLFNKNIEDVTGLEYATNAQWIDLSGNKISDVTPIIDLLTNSDCYIYLQNNLINSLEGIENIKFENVDLSNNYIDFSDNSENLQFIEEYATNYANDVYEENKDQAEGISKERCIEYLKSNIINCCKVQRYGSIEEREDVLEFEDALYNKLIEIGADLNSDGNITKGELNDYSFKTEQGYRVDLANSEITDIENLKYLSGINEIDLSGNNIEDISPLKEIKSLYLIDVSNNKLESIECVQDFFNVNTLNLARNKIKDITPLQYLRTATSLFVGGGMGFYGGGGGIDPVRALSIDLSDNEIEDISVLNEMISLHDANLSGNKITDISALANYDFDALAEGFAIDESYYQYENVTIDVRNNYIDLSDSNNIAAVEHFEEYYSTIKTANQKENEPQYIKGDVNGNGTVDLTDYSMILKHVKGIKTLTGEQLERADVNENGSIDLTDYSMVLKHVKGIKLLN